MREKQSILPYLPYYPFGSRPLQITSPWSIGTDIYILQYLYNQWLSQAATNLKSIYTDGLYGPKTAAAMVAMKAYFQIIEQGVQSKSYYALGQKTQATPMFGSRSLASGMQGDDIAVLQNRLNAYRFASVLQGPATGKWDERTEHAVEKFQLASGVAKDTSFGAVTPPTFVKLWILTPVGGRLLAAGHRGIDVFFLQRRLQMLDFYKGPVDGFFGPKLTEAVETLQKKTNIAQDGIVGPDTFYALGKLLVIP